MVGNVEDEPVSQPLSVFALIVFLKREEAAREKNRSGRESSSMTLCCQVK